MVQARDPIVRDFLRSLAPPASVGTYADIMAITVKGFEKQWVVPLPLPSCCEAVVGSMGGWSVLGNLASARTRSFVTFAMIGRLAEHLVRTNPMVH